jgi:hypothetical protein
MREVTGMPKERTHHAHSSLSDKTVKSRENPVMCKEGKGVRNFACEHYDACLEKAAKGMWSGFTCRECPLSTQKEQETPL